MRSRCLLKIDGFLLSVTPDSPPAGGNGVALVRRNFKEHSSLTNIPEIVPLDDSTHTRASRWPGSLNANPQRFLSELSALTKGRIARSSQLVRDSGVRCARSRLTLESRISLEPRFGKSSSRSRLQILLKGNRTRLVCKSDIGLDTPWAEF